MRQGISNIHANIDVVVKMSGIGGGDVEPYKRSRSCFSLSRLSFAGAEAENSSAIDPV